MLDIGSISIKWLERLGRWGMVHMCIITLLIFFDYPKAHPLTKALVFEMGCAAACTASYMSASKLCTHAAVFNIQLPLGGGVYIVQMSHTPLSNPIPFTGFISFGFSWINPLFPVNDSSGYEFEGDSQMKRQFPMLSGNTRYHWQPLPHGYAAVISSKELVSVDLVCADWNLKHRLLPYNCNLRFCSKAIFLSWCSVLLVNCCICIFFQWNTLELEKRKSFIMF